MPLRRLSVLLLVLGLPPLLGEEDIGQRFAAELERARGPVQAYLDTIDRAEFDLDAFSKSYPEDVDSRAEFVREGIGFDPYPGALRGAAGCFRARSGNGIDRALLLVDLLRRAGHEARLVLGRLPADEATAIAQGEAFEVLDLGAVSFDLPYLMEDAAHVEHRGACDAALVERLTGRCDRLQTAVDAALAAHAPPGRAGAVVKELAEDIRAHAWVRCTAKDGSTRDIDPTFGDPETGSCPGEPTDVVDEPSEDEWHHVTFRGVVERFDGKRVREEEVFVRDFRAADLSCLPVVAEVLPPVEGAGGLGEAVSGEESRTLVLRVAGETEGSGTFQLISSGEAGGPLGGLGAGGNKKGGEVVSVAVEVQASLGRKRGEAARRYLMDRRGHAARAAKDVGLTASAVGLEEATKRLDGTFLSFAVEVGALNKSHLQWRMFRNSIDTSRSIVIREGKVACVKPPADESARLIADAYFHMVDGLREARLSGRCFAAEPRIVCVVFEGGSERLRIHIDVTLDRPRVLEGDLSEPWRGNLEAGLISAVVEEELSRDPLNPADPASYGAASALEASLSKGPPAVVATEEALPPAPPDAAARLRAALKAKRLALLPSEQAAQREFAWFELDPRSGELRATLANGLHDGTEYGELQRENQEKGAAAEAYGNTTKRAMGCTAEKLKDLAALVIQDAAMGGMDAMTAFDAMRTMMAKCAYQGKVVKQKKVDKPEKIKLKDGDPRTGKQHIEDGHVHTNKPDKGKWTDEDWKARTVDTLKAPDRAALQKNGSWMFEKDFGKQVGSRKGEGLNKVRVVVLPDGQVKTSFPVGDFHITIPK